MNRTDVLSVIGAWPSVVGLRRAGAAMLERHGHRLGLWLALGAAFGFSFKAIFVKLAYAVPQAVPVDAVTLQQILMRAYLQAEPNVVLPVRPARTMLRSRLGPYLRFTTSFLPTSASSTR